MAFKVFAIEQFINIIMLSYNIPSVVEILQCVGNVCQNPSGRQRLHCWDPKACWLPTG